MVYKSKILIVLLWDNFRINFELLNIIRLESENSWNSQIASNITLWRLQEDIIE